MKPEDKQLLLKDLCARLPYGVIIHYSSSTNTQFDEDVDDFITGINKTILCVETIERTWLSLERIKPYLRSMKDMTEEEKREYNLTKTLSIVDYSTLESFDWLLSHHFDFRGLIEKGLALEVNESNNPYK